MSTFLSKIAQNLVAKQKYHRRPPATVLYCLSYRGRPPVIESPPVIENPPVIEDPPVIENRVVLKNCKS